MHAKNKVQFHHIPALDGLRGIAILMVVVFHVSPVWLQGGFLGVDIFFILSGFLITSLLLQEFSRFQRVNLKHFYMRRLLRLTPAFVLLVLVYLIVTWRLSDSTQDFKDYAKEAFIALFYLTNWTRALGIHTQGILGHTWSLAIEEQFYLLWPMTLLLALRLGRNPYTTTMVVAMGVALLSWGLRAYWMSQDVSIVRLYNGLDTRVDSLMVGAALAGFILWLSYQDTNDQNPQRQSKARAWITQCIAVGSIPAVGVLASLVWFADWQDPALYYWQFSLCYGATALIIAFLALENKSLVARILGLKPLVFIGTISYGLYLWHYPVLLVLLQWEVRGYTLLAYCGIISLMIASASYYGLEKPLLRLKARFQAGPRS